MKLNGKIAVVTGASSGMGKAIALEYAKEGAKVVAVARRKEKLEGLVEESKEFAGEIVAYQGDLSKKEDAEGVVQYTIDTFGKIDILVNNAGVVDGNTPIVETDDALWEKVMNINLNGVFYASRKAAEDMLTRNSGNIINIASVGGLTGGKAGAAYTASKFGVIGLTKNTAYMYATSGIRCNAICPGGVKSEISLKGVGFENASAFGSQRMRLGAATNPGMAEPEAIATIAVFLASEDSSFINGVALAADGGWIAY